jgi:hypothetical protein
MQTTHEVTRLLEGWRQGDRAAAEQLFALVYDAARRQGGASRVSAQPLMIGWPSMYT